MKKKNPMIKMLILNYLMDHGELTGYEFIKYCRENNIPASSGNVYPQLKKLLEHKIVEYYEEGKKKVYTLTPKGHKIISDTFIANAPQFVKEAIFNSMMFGVRFDWNNPEDIQKVINNLDHLKNVFEQYLKTLKEKT